MQVVCARGNIQRRELLSPKHGAFVYAWFCCWHMLLTWGISALVAANWFLDWVLARHSMAQGVIDVLLLCWCICLLSSAALQPRVTGVGDEAGGQQV